MIVVDRFEGAGAVLEMDTELIEVPRSALPPGATEGSVLKWDVDEASGRLRRAQERLARLKAKDDGKDIIEL